MTNETKRTLALSLLNADSESDVIAILREQGLWDSPENWRLYGDRDGNFSVIGNQQSRPEAALVEKIVNSVDARLTKECLARSIEPTSAEAPQSVREAVAKFIEGVEPVGETAGNVRFWSTERQREQSRKITLAVTGSKPRQEGGASITIVDLGEGQTPAKMPDTFLSIDRENKLRIPFVQGKFNMGGTGALKFCGREGLQLIVTRRCPEVPGDVNGPESPWGFTIVRRVRPVQGIGEVRNSVYRYLAPVGADESPNRGEVLQFSARSINALPDKNIAYARPLGWGSVLKLYEYDMKGFGSHAFMKDGLLGRLELMLPGIALPVRVHECRGYRGEVARSFETTLVGLSARLEANRGKNLEEGFPTSASARVAGSDLTIELYVFKPGRAEAYRKTEGIIFTINGQTHGTLSKSFFSRKKVKMGRLADSLLILVDCSRLSVDAREDLFMNSRDRLSNGELRKAIEEELEDLIGRHHGLRELRERRRASEIGQRLEDSKPLEDVLGTILRTSPSLNRLFLQGQRLNRPHRAGKEGGSKNGAGPGGGFVGKPHPTFFRFAKKPQDDSIRRSAEKGRRCRIKFETDVVNDYFKRASVPGHYYVEVLEGPMEGLDVSHNLVLHDGVANWSINLPDELEVADELTVQCTVTDDTLIEAFVKIAKIAISPRSQSTSEKGERDRRRDSGNTTKGGGDQGGKGENKDAGIRLPLIHRVKEDDQLWRDHDFDHFTGCKVVDDSDPEHPENGAELTFYVNTSNRPFETDLKSGREDPAVAEAKFVYANVLVGLGLLNAARTDPENTAEPTESAEDRVAFTTRALAPFLLPMISYLGSLSPDEVSAGGVGDEE